MKTTNEAGFDGSVGLGNGYTVIFRRGYDKLQLKEFLHDQPCNQFFWCKREQLLLFRNNEGEFYKMNFEKIEL